MKIFSLDSHRRNFCMSVFSDERLYSLESNLPGEGLYSAADNIFRRSGIVPAEIDVFTGCRGPGSFTGLRSGLSFLLGLAGGDKTKIRLIPTFDIYRHRIRKNYFEDIRIAFPAGAKDYFLSDSADSPVTVCFADSLDGAFYSPCGKELPAADVRVISGSFLSREMIEMILCETEIEYSGIDLDYCKAPGITMCRKNIPGLGLRS